MTAGRLLLIALWASAMIPNSSVPAALSTGLFAPANGGGCGLAGNLCFSRLACPAASSRRRPAPAFGGALRTATATNLTGSCSGDAGAASSPPSRFVATPVITVQPAPNALSSVSTSLEPGPARGGELDPNPTHTCALSIAIFLLNPTRSFPGPYSRFCTSSESGGGTRDRGAA